MTPSALDRTFSALADPTRRAILAKLAEGEACVTDLTAPLKLTQSAVTKHVQALERAGLVARRRDRQRRPLRLAPAPLRAAADWIDFYRRFWVESLDRLDEHLRETVKPKEGDAP